METAIFNTFLVIADAETVYALMTIIPAILVVILVVLGLDHDFDIDTDVDVDIDVDVDGDIGADADVGGGPGFLSFKLFLGFVTGFGLLGFLTVHNNWPLHHLIAGFLGGFAFYFILYKILKLLYDMQANSQITSRSLIGRTGLVTSKILQGGIGEIKADDPKTAASIHLRASAVNENAEISKGSTVLIKSVINGLAKVEKIDADDNPAQEANTPVESLMNQESLADAVSKVTDAKENPELESKIKNTEMDSLESS